MILDAYVYTGQDRHSFGIRRYGEVSTPPDRGPWDWDRTGDGKLDERKYGTFKPQDKPKRQGKPPRQGEDPRSFVTLCRNWVRSLPSGKTFTTKDMYEHASKTLPGRSTVSANGALAALKAEGTAVRIVAPRCSLQLWQRL